MMIATSQESKKYDIQKAIEKVVEGRGWSGKCEQGWRLVGCTTAV